MGNIFIKNSLLLIFRPDKETVLLVWCIGMGQNRPERLEGTNCPSQMENTKKKHQKSNQRKTTLLQLLKQTNYICEGDLLFVQWNQIVLIELVLYTYVFFLISAVSSYTCTIIYMCRHLCVTEVLFFAAFPVTWRILSHTLFSCGVYCWHSAECADTRGLLVGTTSLLRVARFQMGPGAIPELELISGLQRPVPLEEVTVLEGRVYGITSPMSSIPKLLSPHLPPTNLEQFSKPKLTSLTPSYMHSVYTWGNS